MLEETVDGWVRKWKRQGLDEGRREGRLEGRREGLQEGLQTGRVDLLERQLSRRFGPSLPTWVHPRLQAAGMEQLDRWAEDLLDAPSLEALFGPE